VAKSRFNDDPFAEAMSKLHSHSKLCAQCKLAMDEKSGSVLCGTGGLLALSVANCCTKLLALKRKAILANDGYVYACPDLSKHGTAYALSAMPFTVSGIQEGLF